MNDQSSDNHSVEDLVNLTLDNSVESLDPEIRRRLNQARIKATEKRRQSRTAWKFAGAVSFLFVLSLTWHFVEIQQPETLMPYTAVLEEDLEMLDDLEFAYWLAEENASAML